MLYYPLLKIAYLTEQNNRVRNSVERIVSLIGTYSPSAQRVLLLDYFDEVLDLLLGEESSPGGVLCFTQRCMRAT
jgi:hypothetical protein